MINNSGDIIHNLILIRGLPGSGKSTLANVLSEGGKYPVLAIDDYFTDKVTGTYQFNYQDNFKAYALCEELTRKNMQAGTEKIFVDNTFTIEFELEPYFKLASEFNYRVFVLTVENRHGTENIHQISDEQLRKMATKYKVVLMPEI